MTRQAFFAVAEEINLQTRVKMGETSLYFLDGIITAYMEICPFHFLKYLDISKKQQRDRERYDNHWRRT
jgi:hypothetical protein